MLLLTSSARAVKLLPSRCSRTLLARIPALHHKGCPHHSQESQTRATAPSEQQALVCNKPPARVSRHSMGRTKRGRDAAADTPSEGVTPSQPHSKQQKSEKKQNQQALKASAAAADKDAGGLSHYVSNIQVLAGDVDHNSPSLLLFLDKGGRLLFNTGEGLQRLFRENKLRTMKLDHYLFTRVSTETMAGLPGMLLSYASGASGNDAAGLLDTPQAASHLYGPAGLGAYVTAFNPYVNQEQGLVLHELPHAALMTEPLLKTQHMSITPVVLQPAAATGPSPATQHGNGVTLEGLQQASAGAYQPPTATPSPSVVYVIELAGTPGKFDRVKAEALGLPHGPERGMLQKGMTVTLADGRVIQPEQVQSPSQPGPLLLVVDLPSTEHLQTLIQQDLLSTWLMPCTSSGTAAHSIDASAAQTSSQQQQQGQQRLCLIAHLSPPAMINTPAYQTWMTSLGPHVRHLLCSMGAHVCTLKRATVLQAKLNCISPVVFPMLQKPSIIQAYDCHPASGQDGAGPASTRCQVTAGNGEKHQAAQQAQQQPQYAVIPGLSQQQAILGTCLLRYNLTPIARQGVDMSEVANEVDPDKVRAEYQESAKDVIGTAYNAVGAAGGVQGLGVSNGTAAAGAAANNSMSVDMAGHIPQRHAGKGKGSNEGKAQACEPTGEGSHGPQAVPETSQQLADVTTPMILHDPIHLDPANFHDRVADADMDMGDHAAAEMPSNVQQQAAEVDWAQEGDVPANLQGISREECEITFLGTASSQPSKYRNVTALYVDLFARGGLFLDCGEDTLGQMKRRFGALDGERRSLAVCAVWISHMHADHHGGLYRLLQLRYERLGPNVAPLLIIGPGLLFPVLRDYQKVVPIPFHFLPNEHLTYGLPGKGPPKHVLDAYQQVVSSLGLAALQPFPVHHVAHACGIRLQGRSGWTVVFSGDTRPCNQLVEAACGASLLIHEATFEDDKQQDAACKKHSTTGEALSVAREAGVYRVILTHFSTRYPTMPVVDIAANPRMAVACDFMCVNLADLPWLPRITAPQAALFKREEVGWEQDEVPTVAQA